MAVVLMFCYRLLFYIFLKSFRCRSVWFLKYVYNDFTFLSCNNDFLAPDNSRLAIYHVVTAIMFTSCFLCRMFFFYTVNQRPYGTAEIQKARDWIKNHLIVVQLSVTMESVHLCIVKVLHWINWCKEIKSHSSNETTVWFFTTIAIRPLCEFKFHSGQLKL